MSSKFEKTFLKKLAWNSHSTLVEKINEGNTMNNSLQDYLETLGADAAKFAPQTDDIKSEDALRRTHAMTVALLEHAQTLIRQAEQEISQQAKRIETLENLAVTDELTGLMNRRGFENAVKRELSFMKRDQSRPGVFVIIDLDKFKPINDTYGHYTGDLALKTVAENLKHMIRTTDIAGRIGGDEFAFFLTNISTKEAVKKLRKINKKLNTLKLAHKDGTIDLHASLGCVEVNSNNKSYEEIYKKADTEMYRVKMLNDHTDYQRNKIIDATNLF